MYNPESEDLLPRSAPKPSALASNENIAKPTVPEVSILFNQDGAIGGHGQTNKLPTSYAAWKKQCLPQVTYPPQESAGEIPRSNVYPMRPQVPPAILQAACGVPVAVSSVPSPPVTLSRNEPRRNSSDRIMAGDAFASHYAPQSYPMYSAPLNHPVYSEPQSAPVSEKTETASRQKSTDDVLTICAGTQTVDIPAIGTENFATKEDIQNVMAFLTEMRAEQSRIMQLLKERTSPNVAPLMVNVGTQCDGAISTSSGNRRSASPPKRNFLRYEQIEEESFNEEYVQTPTIPSNNHRQMLNRDSPKSTPTSSKSNGTVTPVPAPRTTPRSNVVPMLPKPSTERSLVMNELALKYLPSDKLSDLLHEIRITSADDSSDSTGSPLRNIENVAGKNLNDMSSASYKYLKKYRLLPEENNNFEQQQNQRRYHQQSNQENMLDLETIRRQPKLL